MRVTLTPALSKDKAADIPETPAPMITTLGLTISVNIQKYYKRYHTK